MNGFDLKSYNGFFSVFFYFLATFIHYSKKNIVCKVKDNKFKYAYNNGWDDYFEFDDKLVIDNEEKNSKLFFSHTGNTPKFKISLNDYRFYSKKLFKIKKNVIRNYNFIPEKYNSIYIRGGCKVILETPNHAVSKYVDYLLNLKSETNNVFIHSDDNLLVDETINYIKQNNINLNTFKITDEKNNGGSVEKKWQRRYNKKLRNILSHEEMNKEQKKEHMVSFLSAIEIMRKSDNVIVSFDSNTSRFMKINFDCNVYSITGSNNLNYSVPIVNPSENNSLL